MSADEDRARERLIELLAKLDRIREAAKPVRKNDFTHDSTCVHGLCPDMTCDGGDDCENPGFACDCYVSEIAALLAAIDGAP